MRQVDQADESSGADGRGGPPTSTDQIRIAAVEAAVAAGWAEPPAEMPDGSLERPEGATKGTADGEVSGATAPLAVPELPDWVDPPTGQVPRVLLEAAGDAAVGRSGARGPTWREQAADWDDDLGFGVIEEAVDETTGVAGRAASDPLLEGPIEFAELDEDPRRAPLAQPMPSLGPAGEETSATPRGLEEGLAGEDAFAAFAAGAAATESAPTRGRRREGRATTEPTRRGGERRRAVRRQPASERAPERSPEPAPHRAAASVPTRPPAAARPAAAGRRNPVVATLTGLVAGGVAVGAFLGGAVPALVLVTLVATLAAGEAYGTLRRAGRRPASLVGLAGVAALVVGAYLRGPIAVPVVLACGVVISAIWYLAQATEPAGAPGISTAPAADLAATLLVLVWVGVLAAFAGLLLSPAHFPHRHGVAFVFAALVLTVAHDVGSYAAGATLGRHKVAPAVSPNKTWEGLAGGTVLTFLAAFGVAHLHPIAGGTAVGLAVLVCVLGPLGDLTESLVKRDLGVKDMGRVLPAHGGFFDRIDAMLFVLPAAYFLFRVAHPS